MSQHTGRVFPTSGIYDNEKNKANSVFLRQPINGQWHEYTWADTMERARRITSFLKGQGIQPGDKVGILSKNCAEWFMVDFAILMAGAISVPLFATLDNDNIEYIIDHSEIKLLFVGKLDTWQHQQNAIPKTLPTAAMPYDTMPAQYQWEDILKNHAPCQDNYIPNLDDICTIIYTSGTSGRPKGAMIDFNAITNINGYLSETLKLFDLPDHINFLSYLPLAHIFERVAIEYYSIDLDSTISFVESIDTFADNLRDVSPTIFIAVPRIWSIFKNKILEKLPQHKLNKLLKIPLISSFIKYKIKKSLGLSNSVNVSGSAPIPTETLRWFKKLGIEIYQGYGSTENLAYATLNTPEKNKYGSVGPANLGVELKIGENNELLTKSTCMMRGYYKDPELTQKTIDEEGYLHTGDQADIDENGFATIIGRIKDQFKSAKGEYITPVPIEHEFSKNHDIEQCCLIGSGLRQPILVTTLSDAAKQKDHETINRELRQTLDHVNENLPNYSKISHIYIIEEDWTPENGMLTPTLKLRRHEIEAKFGAAANDMQKDTEHDILWSA